MKQAGEIWRVTGVYMVHMTITVTVIKYKQCVNYFETEILVKVL